MAGARTRIPPVPKDPPRPVPWGAPSILGWAWGLLVAINSYMLGYNLYRYSYNPYKLYNPLTKSPKSPEGYNHTYI